MFQESWYIASLIVHNIKDLCEFALSVAEERLVNEGTFICKVMNGNGVKGYFILNYIIF